MEPIIGTRTSQRLAELRATVRKYQQRYGELEGMADITKANSALASRQRRYNQLAVEYERIRNKLESMTSEVERIECWLEFCLEDLIARTRETHSEGWSPTPVLGYRLWAVGNDALHGVKMPWSGRSLTATCLSRGGDDEIPHTDGRCGRLGCGVYAAKTVDSLYNEFSVSSIGDVALGLVALTGKVVEHDGGYRGATATVVALAASLGRHLLLTAEARKIAAVFADPEVISAAPETETETERLLEMETFIELEARRARPWTLVINSA